MYSDENLLMLSGLQHIAFCERQWALIHIEQQWSSSAATVRGDIFHDKVHQEGLTSSPAIKIYRGLRLVSYQLGLIGIADVVEFIPDDESTYFNDGKNYSIIPVEYKVGKAKTEDWDLVQSCAQALCLEEMLACEVSQAALFYGKTKRRVSFEITKDLRERVRLLAERMHELFEGEITPRAEKSKRCNACSLLDSCVPELGSKSAITYWKTMY